MDQDANDSHEEISCRVKTHELDDESEQSQLFQSMIQFSSSDVPRIVQSTIQGKVDSEEDDQKQYYMSQSCKQKEQTNNNYIEDLLFQRKIQQSIFAKRAEFDGDEFSTKINLASVQFCITSPATRSLFANQQQVKSRTTLVQNANKIWLENQSDCFHSMFDAKTLRILIKCETTKIPKFELLKQFHCDNLKEFVNLFCGLPEVRDAIFASDSLKETSHSDKYGINSGCSDVLNALSAYMRQELVGIDEELKNTNSIELATERYLTRMIYEKLYPKQPTARDIELNMRLKTLEWVTEDYLSIKVKDNNALKEQLNLSAQMINQMDKHKTTVDKLDCVLQSTQSLSEKITQINGKAASADDVFPAFIRILILAQSTRLQSDINFIELFSNKSRMMSHEGYSFTQLKSALIWIENVNHEQLKMDSLQYNRNIQEKIVKYGMCKRRERRKRILLF